MVYHGRKHVKVDGFQRAMEKGEDEFPLSSISEQTRKLLQ